MERYYSSERAAQILVSLLKQHNIKKIIASPGTTNITFVASAMYDPWFEMYSSVDERSAAYIACGLAAESGEPVVITCTGATASRNYMPGLTEAYYRKLPVLAVTASQSYDKIGHMSPQLLDRRQVPADVARKSFTVKAVKDKDDEWADEIAINNALLELRRHGGGPVHLNFQTTYSRVYDCKELPVARKISRVMPTDKVWPEMPSGDGNVAVIVGSHAPMSAELTEAIDRFCATHNAVAFCDHTSNYYGRYRVQMSLLFSQLQYRSNLRNPKMLVHIGEISGDYPTLSVHPAEVWRVSEDGELRDYFRRLTSIFEMPELTFFEHYGAEGGSQTAFLDDCRRSLAEVADRIPELPFTNPWIAQHTAPKFPAGSVVHLGILNTLRSWNYFPFPEGVRGNCNVGGFGIDGMVSTAVGASLADRNRLVFVVVGDLGFFYDLNAIGNRHVGRNLRLLLINNGRGTEFRNFDHPGAAFGDDADAFIAAAGHYGNKSPQLVKHYAEDLGFDYLSASTKEEYLAVVDRFTSPELSDRPMLLEVFTDSTDESDAQKAIRSLVTDAKGLAISTAKNILGAKGIKAVRSILGK